jgi:hypothetical protein
MALVVAVHLLAYSDAMNAGTCAFVETATAHGWEPFITSGGYHGKAGKLAFWGSLVDRFPPDDIVWIVDAWDTVVQLNARHVAEQYERYEAYHGVRGVVVAAAETNCWPFKGRAYQPETCKGVCCQWGVSRCEEMTGKNMTFLATRRTRYLYLNSGSIVTRAGSLLALTEGLGEIGNLAGAGGCEDDQAILSAAYRFHNNGTIVLDHDGVFSATTWDSRRDFVFENRLWRHHGVYPAAIHCNGGINSDTTGRRFLAPMEKERNGTFIRDGVVCYTGRECEQDVYDVH